MKGSYFLLPPLACAEKKVVAECRSGGADKTALFGRVCKKMSTLHFAHITCFVLSLFSVVYVHGKFSSLLPYVRSVLETIAQAKRKTRCRDIYSDLRATKLTRRTAPPQQLFEATVLTWSPSRILILPRIFSVPISVFIMRSFSSSSSSSSSVLPPVCSDVCVSACLWVF